MKEKIVLFLVGLLLGAIISTGSIYAYTVASKNNKDDGFRNDIKEIDRQTPPDMPNGNNQNNNNNNN